ncbi:MAG: hypothetical protein JWQ09_2522 [Segetibacter sp.]|nr:hypothetical protein [Segetibacter sp.]
MDRPVKITCRDEEIVDKILFNLKSRFKPCGFVIATGLHPRVSETASHVSEYLRLRLAPNGLMSLMQ